MSETRRVSSADASKHKLLLRPSSTQDLKPNKRGRYTLCTETQFQHCIRVSTARRHTARNLPSFRADLTKDIVCTQPQDMNLDVQRTDTSTLQAQPGDKPAPAATSPSKEHCKAQYRSLRETCSGWRWLPYLARRGTGAARQTKEDNDCKEQVLQNIDRCGVIRGRQQRRLGVTLREQKKTWGAQCA